MSTGSVTRRMTLALALGGVLLLTGCAAIYRDHGYVPLDEDLAQIEVGKTSRDEVVGLIGRPSSAGVLEGSGMYYVGSRWKYLGARAPQEIDRQVVAISFDSKDTVSNVERFGLEKGEVIVLSRRVTDSNIKGITLARQLLGSLGRVNASQILQR